MKTIYAALLCIVPCFAMAQNKDKDLNMDLQNLAPPSSPAFVLMDISPYQYRSTRKPAGRLLCKPLPDLQEVVMKVLPEKTMPWNCNRIGMYRVRTWISLNTTISGLPNQPIRSIRLTITTVMMLLGILVKKRLFPSH